jgi:hypothetical protein
MTIEFLCTNCQQPLRVPDTAAGKHARCPQCSTIQAVPATPGEVDFSERSPGPSPGFGDSPFSQREPKLSPGMTELRKPWDGGNEPVNPYASPAGGFNESRPLSGAIGHQRVEIGDVMNYSFRIWQDNLGLLVGATFVTAVIMLLINSAGGSAIGVMFGGDPVILFGARLMLQLVGFAVGSFLGIGQAIIFLKLARGQRAEFSDMFSGGPRFLPVIGLLLLTGGPHILLQTFSSSFGGRRGFADLVMMSNSLLMLYFLVYAILALYWWPAYYLVLEDRAGVFQSFGLAARITEGNKLQSFLLFLLMYGMWLLGCLALVVGLLFAIPLTQLMLAVAYLMMTGQLPTKPAHRH